PDRRRDRLLGRPSGPVGRGVAGRERLLVGLLDVVVALRAVVIRLAARHGVIATAASGVATRKVKVSSKYSATRSASWWSYPMDRSWPDSNRKSPPRRLTTTAPSTPGAQTMGPPRIWRRWSNTTSPPCSVVSTTPVYPSGPRASP